MKVLFAVAVSAAAVSSVVADDFCDQWGTTTSGDYIIYNDLWGESYATSGSQCTGLDSNDGSTIAWHTNYSWAGASTQVKSYANAALQFDAVQLSGVSSIPSTMEYTYTYDDTLIADVAYDLFTSSTADGDNEFEVMIWLAALGGAGPISSTGSAVATTTIGSVEFSLYSGANGDTTVYSFVASAETTSFSGDLMDFFNYLTENEGMSTSQYLTTVECGTEPFTGTNAVLTVSSYSAAVNTGTSSSESTDTTGSTVTTTNLVADSTAASASTEADAETTTTAAPTSTDAATTTASSSDTATTAPTATTATPTSTDAATTTASSSSTATTAPTATTATPTSTDAATTTASSSDTATTAPTVTTATPTSTDAATTTASSSSTETTAPTATTATPTSTDAATTTSSTTTPTATTATATTATTPNCRRRM
ncbi:hypothetical protein BBJ28_00000323 [Nothophytophthora sp. Chile5]|nr:hypothetical protein BBJ28_00000323 [Nothophytophthora sp. Chile5]